MKLKVVEFASFEEFENSGVSGQDNIITVIRENGVLKMDVMMTAKNLKSALERLHNALKNYPDIAAFVWSSYHIPQSYHAIGMSHAYAYCDKHDMRVSEVRGCKELETRGGVQVNA